METGQGVLEEQGFALPVMGQEFFRGQSLGKVEFMHVGIVGKSVGLG